MFLIRLRKLLLHQTEQKTKEANDKLREELQEKRREGGRWTTKKGNQGHRTQRQSWSDKQRQTHRLSDNRNSTDKNSNNGDESIIIRAINTQDLSKVQPKALEELVVRTLCYVHLRHNRK